MLRTIVFSLAAILILGSFWLVIQFEKTKFYVDLYANHATVVGFWLGVAGFILTIWTVFEGLRANREAQARTEVELAQYRAELKRVLDNVRSQTFREACDEAYSCLIQTEHAIHDEEWIRAMEKAGDARKFVLRILNFDDLTQAEQTNLRDRIMNLRVTIEWIQRRRKLGTELKVATTHFESITLFRDELDRLRSRLNNKLMGNADVIASVSTKN